MEKLRKAIDESKGLDVAKAGQYTLGQWMRVWYENYATIKVRPSSHATYRGIIKNHIDPAIGQIPLTKLTTLDLQKFYRDLLTGGRVERKESEKKPKGLGPKTVRNIHQIISSALQLAIHQKLIAHNPAEGCALPRVERNEMKTLTADQLSAFLQEAKNTGVFEMYYLELATGLRRGELLGLKWTDVDFHQGTITVRRQISRIDGKVVEAPLKTKNAYRVIPLGEQALAVLQSQQEKTHSEYVFPSPNGGPISPDSVRNMLRRVLKRAGLPYVRFHDLRHTFATLALQNGVDVKPGPLQRRFHPGHLCPRHHHRPAGGGQEDGWGAGAEGAVRKIPGAGMRWHPLQSLTQTQGKAVWVRYGSRRKTTPEPRSSGVVLCCPFWRKNSAGCTATAEMKTVNVGDVQQKTKENPR